MRLTPRSLAGRLTLLLLLALAIAQGIAVFLFAEERVEAVRHAHRDNVMVRAGTVARLLADTPDALHDPIVSAASTEFVRFSLTEEPLVGEIGTGTRAAAIAQDLSVALDVGRERIRVAPPWGRHRPDDDRDDHRGSTTATTMTRVIIITAPGAGGATGSPRPWPCPVGAG